MPMLEEICTSGSINLLSDTIAYSFFEVKLDGQPTKDADKICKRL